MSIKVIYKCNGCFVEASVDLPGATFDSFNGKGYGFGYIRYPNVRDHVPDGWIDYDPYTYCTYCPVCVKEIWPEEAKEQEAMASPPVSGIEAEGVAS